MSWDVEQFKQQHVEWQSKLPEPEPAPPVWKQQLAHLALSRGGVGIIGGTIGGGIIRLAGESWENTGIVAGFILLSALTIGKDSRNRGGGEGWDWGGDDGDGGDG